jgi:hypothetical protein
MIIPHGQAKHVRLEFFSALIKMIIFGFLELVYGIGMHWVDPTFEMKFKPSPVL